nr:hypothetical protein [uncultured Dysosmobacter sp.]
MNNEEAARILDPETSREALAPYAHDGHLLLAVTEEACTVAAKVLLGPDVRTNADRIRAMSDEELGEFISRIEIGDFGQLVYGKTFCDMCNGQYECGDCRLWWLQQPAEEDTP